VWRYFHQIQSGFQSHILRFLNGYHAHIVAILIDQTNFSCAYPIIYPVICAYGLPRLKLNPLRHKASCGNNKNA
jgi:hypothetical protein